MRAVPVDFTGELHHVPIRKVRACAVVRHREHHLDFFPRSPCLDEIERYARISPAVRLTDEFVHGRDVDVLRRTARFNREIAVFPHGIVQHEAMKRRLQIVIDIDGVERAVHLLVDLQNRLPPRFGG